MSTTLRDRAAAYFRGLQGRIVAELEALDGEPFHEDSWRREGGGGGRSRVLSEGGLFEKAGVNFSDVHGEFSEEFAKQVPGEGRRFTACGVSSGSAAAGVPGRGLKTKLKLESKPISSISFIVFAWSSSVSPGKPAMKSVETLMPGRRARSLRIVLLNSIAV